MNLVWKLEAEVKETLNGFTNVVTNVHWRLTGTDETNGEKMTIYGSQTVPAPEEEADFIDLTILQGKPEAEIRDTILGWAEAVEPGFVAEKETQITKMLEEKRDEVKTTHVSLI